MKVFDITAEQPLVKKFTVLEKGIKVITDDKEHPYPHSRLGPDVDIGSHEDTTHPYVIPSSQQVDANGDPIYGAEAGMRWYGQETPAGMDIPSDHELIQQLIGELEGELENGTGWGDEEGSGYVSDGDGDAGAGDGEGHGDGPYTGDGTGEGPYTGQDGDYGPEVDVTDGSGEEGEHGAGDGSSIDDGPSGGAGDGPSGDDTGPTTQGDPEAQAGPLTPEIRPDIVIPPPVVITPGQDDTQDVPSPEPDDDDKEDEDDPLEHGHGDEIHSHDGGDQEHDHDEDEDEEGDVEDGTDADVDPDADEGEDESPVPNDPEGDSPEGGPGVGDDPSGVPSDPESTPEPDEEGGVDMGPIDGPADPDVFQAQLNPDGSWKDSDWEAIELALSVIQARQFSQGGDNGSFTDIRFPGVRFNKDGTVGFYRIGNNPPTFVIGGNGPTRKEIDQGFYNNGKEIDPAYYESPMMKAVRDSEQIEGYIDPVNGVWPKEVMDIIKAESLEMENESIDFSRLENKLKKIQEKRGERLSPDNTPKKKQDNQSGNYTGQDSIFGDGIKVVTYIGPNASGWNNTAYLKAVELQKQGASEDEIWQQTRTVFDPIGNPHQEITDHKSTLITDKPEGWEYGSRTTLDKVIDHPELFKQYPQLKNIIVWHDTIGYGGTANGWTSGDGTTIGLKHMPGFNNALGNINTDRQKEILLHEIFHAIDIIEGRIPDIGPWKEGSPTGPRIRRIVHDDTGIPKWEVYAGSQFEIAARDTENRADMDDEERDENTPRLQGGSEEDGGVPKTVIIKGPFDQSGDDADDYEVIDNPNINKPPYKPKGRDESIDFSRLENKLRKIQE